MNDKENYSLLSHLSKINGCGGKRKETLDGFVVEEIIDGKPVREIDLDESNGEYLIFILEKRGYSTYEAIKKISKTIGVSFERFGVAGQKDKKAITYQLVSLWGKNVNLEKLLNIDKNIKILKYWRSNKKIKIGELTGNRFKVIIEDYNNSNKIFEILKDNRGFIPNYFGPQRFGAKNNNVQIAKDILLKKYEDAIRHILGAPLDEDINCYLDSNLYVGYEKKIINLLNKNRNEKDIYKKSINLIPKTILKLIIESYQSYLFNLELSERIKTGNLEPLGNEKMCGFNRYGFIDERVSGNNVTCTDLVGYDTKPNDIVDEILWNEGLEIGDFKIRDFPELSCKGSIRPLLANIKDLNINENNNELILQFALPKGAYATSALRELCGYERI